MIVFFDKLRNRRKMLGEFRADVDDADNRKLEQLMLQHEVLVVIRRFMIINVL